MRYFLFLGPEKSHKRNKELRIGNRYMGLCLFSAEF
jgi:hypothetical protein